MPVPRPMTRTVFPVSVDMVSLLSRSECRIRIH
jgi:hypothetical protein